MSSKTYKLIKEIRPPVLSVAGKSTVINRILICSGGKQYIDDAVRLTGEIARGLGATVTLLHVTSEPPGILAHLPQMEQDTALLLGSQSELGQNLRREKETLESFGVTTEVKLRHGSVLAEILREVREGNHDLVVTGSALSRSLRTYVLGDVSREIVNHATCAVLVGRSQQIPAAPHFPFKWFSRTPRPT
jgi:nucleotide-binding universal stress UspA family protein